MTSVTNSLRLGRERGRLSLWLAALVFFSATLLAQTARITTEIDSSVRAIISGSQPPRTRLAKDMGRVPVGTKLRGISIVFGRSVAQEAKLKVLIAAQQNPASPLYHHWLTSAEFAMEFGVADSDITKVRSWLDQQGFIVDGVANSRNRIAFSGTVGQVEAAFDTELHYYGANGDTHYAPSKNLSVPVALSAVVQSVANLSSFRPKPHIKVEKNFTSSQSGSHYLTPKDVETIYDITAVYNAGSNGAGQAIAAVGQSEVSVSDVENFQTAAGLTVKDPILVLVPNSGTAAVSSGDEAESDLDLEYSGAIAPGATIYFVYVGNNSNYSVWDSIAYAVDTRITPIISVSYGDCETELGSSNYATLNGVLEQAAAQGQSVIAAAGDSGSTDCSGYTDLTTPQQEALVVDFPASSQYVTGMGGTEFPSADVSSSNTTYWESASGSDVVGSALSYIPEQVWNDDSSSSGLSSGGGGVSIFTARPSWQTGVSIPSGSYRLVPDISLDASPHNAGFLYCSSDSSATGVTGSCSDGFRDSNDTYLTVAGGTSFDAPIFAGMLAIINQKENSTGQGVVNSTLYTLAANSTTYASAFHDITNGGNQCTAGSSYCASTGASRYAAAKGYDEASGLGSIDFYNLLTVWPATAASSLAASSTTLATETSSPASGVDDTITLTVISGSSSSTATPTGTLTIAVDGTTVSSSLTLDDGSATYTFSSTTTGSHIVTAAYSGDSTYAASTGTLALTVSGSTSSGTVSLTAANLTVSTGSSGSSTITVSPHGGYTGTITFTASTNSSLSNACYSISDATVSGTSAVTTSLTVYTSVSACSSTSFIKKGGGKSRFITSGGTASENDDHRFSGFNTREIGVSIAVLLLAGMLAYRPRKFCAYGALLLVAALSLGLSSCGSSSSSSSSDATKGTYTLTVVGTDSSQSSITASTTMTLTID